MNPLELAKQIEAMIVDYDLNTTCTALDIVKLLVAHREHARIAFNQSLLSERSSPDRQLEHPENS